MNKRLTADWHFDRMNQIEEAKLRELESIVDSVIILKEAQTLFDKNFMISQNRIINFQRELDGLYVDTKKLFGEKKK